MAQDAMQQAQIDQAMADDLPAGVSAPIIVQRPSASGSIQIQMKDRTRGAVIFYTTDGWTPTPASKRYMGRFVVDRTTTLRAVAYATALGRSAVKQVTVTIPGSKPRAADETPATVTLLKPGTPLVLQFADTVDSSRLEIGDPLPVVTSQDIVVAGKLLAPRLTPVSVSVSQVDKHGFAGQPGSISFVVHSITLNDGQTIPLVGGETAEGAPRTKAAFLGSLVPVVGAGSLLVHGSQAVILKDERFTAHIAAPTP